MRRSFFLVAMLSLAGCPTTAANDTGTTPGNDAAVVPGIDSGTDAATVTPVDGGNDAATVTTADANTIDGGCSGVLLTVIDSLSWCDITVNGGTAFPGAMETVCVPASTDVALTQQAHTGFILGKWFGTDDDHGSGDTGTVAAMVSTAHVMTGAAGTSACVSVCCPFPGGTGCPATDACP